MMGGTLYDVVIDAGFFLTIRIPVELRGVVLPLMRSSSHEERATAQAAKDLAMHVLLNRWLWVETVKDSPHPKTWSVKLYLDATSEREGVMTEVCGSRMVDFSAYMNSLSGDNYDTKKVDLVYASGSERSRKTFQRGS